MQPLAGRMAQPLHTGQQLLPPKISRTLNQAVIALPFITKAQKLVELTGMASSCGRPLFPHTSLHCASRLLGAVLRGTGRAGGGGACEGRRGAERGRAQVCCQLQTPSCSEESPPVSSLAPAHPPPPCALGASQLSYRGRAFYF